MATQDKAGGLYGKDLRQNGASPPVTPTPDEKGEEITREEMTGDYTALRPENKRITRMHVIDERGDIYTFQYVYLDARSWFKGDTFLIRFVGAEHWELTVKGGGPKFYEIYDYITLHRWPYLRVATRDFEIKRDDTVISGVRLFDATPKPQPVVMPPLDKQTPVKEREVPPDKDSMAKQ